MYEFKKWCKVLMVSKENIIFEVKQKDSIYGGILSIHICWNSMYFVPHF